MDDNFYEVFFCLLKSEIVDSMQLTVSRVQAYGRVENSMRDMTVPYRPTGSVSMGLFPCKSESSVLTLAIRNGGPRVCVRGVGFAEARCGTMTSMAIISAALGRLVSIAFRWSSIGLYRHGTYEWRYWDKLEIDISGVGTARPSVLFESNHFDCT